MFIIELPVKKSLIIPLGVVLFAFGNVIFAFPNQISAGGITGLSTLLYYHFGWNVGMLFFLLNVPLFAVAWFFSKPLFVQSLGSMMLCSFLIGWFEPLAHTMGIRFILAGSIAGGMIMGVGIGIMGMANASLGGGSLTGKMLAMKFGISFSLCTFVFDAAVYPFFYYLYGWEQTLFSLILTFCSSVGIFAVEQFRRIPGLMQHKVSSGR